MASGFTNPCRFAKQPAARAAIAKRFQKRGERLLARAEEDRVRVRGSLVQLGSASAIAADSRCSI